MSNRSNKVDFEFTFALNNRTGKYFVCKEILNACQDLIGRTWYWRVALKQEPQVGRLTTRILGRLAQIEIEHRLDYPNGFVPLLQNRRPVVFGDPREVLLYRLKSNDIVLCHDVGPISHPTLYHFPASNVYARAYDHICVIKPHLVFVSQASMEEFARRYGNDFPFMKVAHPPLRVDIDAVSYEPVEGISGPFLLTVGAIGSRKNQLRAIEAFERSQLAQKGFHYVICGGPEPGFEAVRLRAGRTPGVVLPGYVNDQQLRWLYREAKGFILPSLLEGFGLPAAEAISRGLVPLVSTGGALEEVTGVSAILINPTSIEEISAGMLQLAEMSPEERRFRLAALNEAIARFSMDNFKSVWRSVIECVLANTEFARDRH